MMKMKKYGNTYVRMDLTEFAKSNCDYLYGKSLAEIEIRQMFQVQYCPAVR